MDRFSFLSQAPPPQLSKQLEDRRAENRAAVQLPHQAYFKLPNRRFSLLNKAEVVLCDFFILHLHLRLSLANRTEHGGKKQGMVLN